MTGFFRDGCCNTDPRDVGSHTICAVVTEEFLAHQRCDPGAAIPVSRAVPGDRWCVTARNWLRAHADGVSAPVILAATHERAIEAVPVAVLWAQAVDVPNDVAGLE